MLMRSPPPAWRRRVPPGFIPPCQPVLADKVPSGDGWLHELKHDGFQIIAHKTATAFACGRGTGGIGLSSSLLSIARVVRSEGLGYRLPPSPRAHRSPRTRACRAATPDPPGRERRQQDARLSALVI